MRNRRSSKQRLWLGSSRYTRRGGRRYTDADADCYSNADRDGYSQSHGYSATDPDTEAGTISQAAPHTTAQGLISLCWELRQGLIDQAISCREINCQSSMRYGSVEPWHILSIFRSICLEQE